MLPARLPRNIIPCRPLHLAALAEHMRECERRQFHAVLGGQQLSIDTAVHALVNAWALSGPYAVTVLHADGMTPAAAGGFERVSHGVWLAWMVGTEHGWTEQWRAMTKGSRWLMDRLFEDGARRIQANALTDRVAAIEWFERSLGMKPEGVWRGQGANGEDFAHFSRMRDT